MAIYVEKNVLKCAPFGYRTDEALVLSYEGIDPLETEEWQHISCIYIKNLYVKG